VKRILVAQKQLAAAQSDADKDFYGNKCAGLDRQIDALVYELYGLTPDEIKIMEEPCNEHGSFKRLPLLRLETTRHEASPPGPPKRGTLNGSILSRVPSNGA